MEEAVPHLVSMEHLSRFASVPSIFFILGNQMGRGTHTHSHTIQSCGDDAIKTDKVMYNATDDQTKK